MANTANYRGFVATFGLLDDHLILSDLWVYTDQETRPCLGNIEPIASGHDLEYKDMIFPICYEGSVRIAKGFVREMYVHMGFQKPSAFKTVIDLTFSEGKLVKTQDRSEEAKEIRGKFKEYYHSQSSIVNIEKSFSLDMEFI